MFEQYFVTEGAFHFDSKWRVRHLLLSSFTCPCSGLIWKSLTPTFNDKYGQSLIFQILRCSLFVEEQKHILYLQERKGFSFPLQSAKRCWNPPRIEFKRRCGLIKCRVLNNWSAFISERFTYVGQWYLGLCHFIKYKNFLWSTSHKVNAYSHSIFTEMEVLVFQ